MKLARANGVPQKKQKNLTEGLDRADEYGTLGSSSTTLYLEKHNMNEDYGFFGACDDVPAPAIPSVAQVYHEPQGDRSHPADWGWPDWWGSFGYGDSYIPPRHEWPEGWKPAR
jgi:hypothetical protein